MTSVSVLLMTATVVFAMLCGPAWHNQSDNELKKRGTQSLQARAMNEIFRKAFLPDQTRISQVRLRTANLERALGFYTGPLGLRIVERTGGSGQVGISATGRSPAI